MSPVASERYSYFEHDADIGLAGHGATLEEAFEGAAAGMFAIITDLNCVRRERTVKLEFEESDVELALVRWLNLLLATAREQRMIFAEFRLDRDGVVWRGTATGEGWHGDHERGVEVKGATLTMLRVEQREGSWDARCVVDV